MKVLWTLLLLPYIDLLVVLSLLGKNTRRVSPLDFSHPLVSGSPL